MLLKSGTYHITNVLYSGQAVEVSLKPSTANLKCKGSPIVSYTSAKIYYPNQHWRAEVTGDSAFFKTVLNTAAFITTTRECKLVIGLCKMFRLVETDKEDVYRIQAVDKELYWVLKDGQNCTQLELQPLGVVNDPKAYEWKFAEPQPAAEPE